MNGSELPDVSPHSLTPSLARLLAHSPTVMATQQATVFPYYWRAHRCVLCTLQDHHKGDQVVIEAMEAQLLSAKAALQELEDSEDSHILRTLNLQRMKRTLPTTRRR